MKITDLLRTMDIFEHLAPEELEKIARLLRERRLTEGQALCRQGEAGDAMFIVTGGSIQLTTTDPQGNERLLTHFTDGQFFGEMALLTGAPRSASATAVTESRVLVLQKEDFDQLLSGNAQIMREMLKVVSQRTVQTNQQLVAEDSTSTASSGAGRIYAVFSPRGGSGKTTLAVNLAVALARQLPDRVGLLDLDLTFGHDALLLNLQPESSLAAVPPESLHGFDRQTLGRYLVRHPSGLQLLVGGARPEEGEAVTGDHVRAALAVMKRQFTAVVVDCQGNFSDPTLAALEMSDKVIVVCTPELNTLHDVREVQRIFGEVIHLDKAKMYYVLNYYQPFKVLAREQFEAALEQPIGTEILHAGDSAIKAALKGEPLVLGGNPAFSKAVEKIILDIEPAEARAARTRTTKATQAPPTNGASHARQRGLLTLFKRS